MGLVGPPDGPWIGGGALPVDDNAAPPDNPDEPETTGGFPRPSRFRVVAAVLVLTLLAMTAGVGAWAWTRSQLVTVPDLIGATPLVAQKALENQGLQFALGGKDFSARVPIGRIVATDPMPGGQVSEGDTVTVRQSAGPQMVDIPRIVGDSEEVAVTALKKAGFVPDLSQDYSDFVNPGNVISATPETGSSAPLGSTVALVISKGPPPVIVPDVLRQTQDSAVETLESAGLTVNVVNQLPVVVVGRVYSQDPAPGTEVKRGTTITITIV